METTTKEPEEPAVRKIEAYVCDACLDGRGQECHVPACLFCFRDVPRFGDTNFATLRVLLDGRGLIDGKLLLDGELLDVDPFEDADDDEELIDEDPDEVEVPADDLPIWLNVKVRWAKALGLTSDVPPSTHRLELLTAERLKRDA